MRAALLAAALAVAPAAGVAQIRGVVRDEAGRPVAEAVVELLSAGARLAVVETDTAGRFLFLAAPGAAGLVVRRIGYAPARVTLGRSDGLEITLRRRTVAVAGVTARAAGLRCVERDQAAARRVWEGAARRYATGTAVRALWGEGRRAGANVPPESLGTMDTARAERVVVSGTGFLPLPVNRDRFYARPPLLGGERSYQWDYPWLESVQAWHFADPLFGDLNRFAAAPADLGQLVLEFCSRRGSRPYITGRLYLAADTSFLKTEWRFVTERPSEDAGGEVVFMPPAAGAPLLAASGHFWRARVHGYYQEWTSYAQWFACEGLRGECGPGLRRALGR